MMNNREPRSQRKMFELNLTYLLHNVGLLYTLVASPLLGEVDGGLFAALW